MADIGNLSAKVTASSAGLGADMKKAADVFGTSTGALEKVAADKGRSIGQKMGDGIASGLSKLKGLGDSAFTNPLKAVNDVLLAGVADFIGKVPYIGGVLATPLQAASAGLGFAIGVYEQNSDRVSKLGIGAAKTGLDVGDFQIFAKLTNGAEGAERAWFKFSQKLSEASMTVDGAKTSFDRFGIDGKAISEEFESDFTGAIGKVADRFRQLPATMRSSFLRENFGKGGLEMAPLLMKGSAGIGDLKADMDRLGVTINGGLVESVKQAAKAKKQIDMLWEGFGNQITSVVAPALAIISESVGKLPGGFAGLGEIILDKVGVAAEFVASIIDGWTNGDMMERMAPYWETFKEKGGEVIDWAVARLTDGLKAAFSIPPPEWMRSAADSLAGTTESEAFVKKSEEDLDKLRKEMGLSDADQWKKGDGLRDKAGLGNDRGGGDYNDPIKVKFDADDNAHGMLQRLREEFKGDKAGLDDATDFLGLDNYFGKMRLKAMNLKLDIQDRMNSKGPTSDIDPLAKFQDRINTLNDGLKGPLGEFAESMGGIQQTMDAVAKADPFDQMAKSLKEAGFGMREMGEMMKDMETASPLKEGAAEMDAFRQFQKLKGAAGSSGPNLAGAMEQGSAGAYSAIVQFENQKVSVEEEMKQILLDLKAINEAQLKVGQDALKARANLKLDGVDI